MPPANTITSNGTRNRRLPTVSRTRPTASTPAAFHLSATWPTKGRTVKLGTEKARSAHAERKGEQVGKTEKRVPGSRDQGEEGGHDRRRAGGGDEPRRRSHEKSAADA